MYRGSTPTIYRGSTPTIKIIVDYDLTDAVVLFVTFDQNGRTVLEKSIEDIVINPDCLLIKLSQVDTLMLEQGKQTSPVVEVQIRGRMPNGDAPVSDRMTTTVEKILKNGVI